MEIKGKRTAHAGRLFEVAQKAMALKGLLECACCLKTKPGPQFKGGIVESYTPRSLVMLKAVPIENIAAYLVCRECVETIPEGQLFLKCEKFLISRGLLNKGQKPLNEPGRHSPKRPASAGPRIITNE